MDSGDKVRIGSLFRESDLKRNKKLNVMVMVLLDYYWAEVCNESFKYR